MKSIFTVLLYYVASYVRKIINVINFLILYKNIVVTCSVVVRDAIRGRGPAATEIQRPLFN